MGCGKVHLAGDQLLVPRMMCQADPTRGGPWRVGPHTGFPQALEQLLSLYGPLLGARTPSPVPLQAPGHVSRMGFILRLPEGLCSGLAHRTPPSQPPAQRLLNCADTREQSCPMISSRPRAVHLKGLRTESEQCLGPVSLPLLHTGLSRSLLSLYFLICKMGTRHHHLQSCC